MKRLIETFKINKNIPLENKLKQLEDISIHKGYVIKTSHLLAKYLFENNREMIALKLMERAFSHDVSKLGEIEFYGMAEFAFDLSALKDPKGSISKEKEYYINIHRRNNKHHPEYWDSTLEMTELDIMELACDWCARSLQFETNPIDFLKERQNTQFHFPKQVYNEVEKYLSIISEQIKREN